ncbi:ABC transporter permease subunit [Gymnodinialimonas sp. 2305UL16-5]|uniref:carbohydrate ABC transporter permease n=1 Tax=Gymnodinialimonas mytili TaxID=3126503 RepID=UPI00309CD554
MPKARLFDHVILTLGCVFMLGPLALLLWRAGVPQGVAGAALIDAASQPNTPSLSHMLGTSFIIALGVASVKTLVSVLAAYALVFFRLPFASMIFAAVLLPLFLPIESRILPTFLVVDALGLLNTYTGLILPVTATGLGTLILRAQLLQIPLEVVEAARLDGAGPGRVLIDFILPLSVPILAALFAFFFVLGWNQYLWPLIASPSVPDRASVVSGIALLQIGSPASLALATVAMLPPLMVFAIAQRWIVKGLAPMRS